MKQLLTILSLVAMVLAAGVREAKAAGETGHSDWMRVMFEIYGFDVELARHLSAINQGVDNVPGAAATQSGVAAEVIHFSRVISKTDLMHITKVMNEIQNEHHDISFGAKLKLAIFRIAKAKSIGDSTGALSNAASVEYWNKSIIQGDLTGDGIASHMALDGNGYHNGYKGAFHVPFLGNILVNKIPIFGKALSGIIQALMALPFGHMVDGTSVDRTSIGKMALSMYTMGDFLITMRESLKDVGVNKEWLGYLQSQGVDIQNAESIAIWFFSQPEIAKILQAQIPALKTQEYFDLVLKEVAHNLISLNFFRDQIQMEELLREISNNRELYLSQVNKNTTYEQLAMRDLIKKAKLRGLLNEEVVIRETVTDYLSVPNKRGPFKEFGMYVESKRADLLMRTKSIDDLIQAQWDFPDYVQLELAKLHEDLSTERPFSENWILDQIAEKITRNMVHYRFSRFNTAYLKENVESGHIEIERKAIVNIEEIYLKLANSPHKSGKYFYKPGAEHRSKVRSELFNFENYRGMNILEAFIKAADIIVTTKLTEEHNIISIPTSVKLKIFVKTMAFLVNKKSSPITTKGGYMLRNKELREIAIQYLAEKKPDGVLSVEDYEKIKTFNEEINRKYNSDEAVGLVQKTASGIKTGVQLVQRLFGNRPAAGAAVRCEAYFN